MRENARTDAEAVVGSVRLIGEVDSIWNVIPTERKVLKRFKITVRNIYNNRYIYKRNGRCELNGLQR